MFSSFIIDSKLDGSCSPLSFANIRAASAICLRLLTLVMRDAFAFALLRDGSNIPARIARMAKVTSTLTAPVFPLRMAAPMSAIRNSPPPPRTMIATPYSWNTSP